MAAPKSDLFKKGKKYTDGKNVFRYWGYERSDHGKNASYIFFDRMNKVYEIRDTETIKPV